MKSTKRTLFLAVLCLGLGFQAHAKNGVKVDKTEKLALKSEKKACIDDIKAKLTPIKEELDAACITEADEETEACMALSEQVSALKSQIKECRSK